MIGRIERQLLDKLEGLPPVTTSEIQRITGWPAKKVKNTVARLIDRGLLLRYKHPGLPFKRYRAVAIGQETAA
jgi:DNA-binding Lrp family transcriptional regulator